MTSIYFELEQRCGIKINHRILYFKHLNLKHHYFKIYENNRLTKIKIFEDKI